MRAPRLRCFVMEEYHDAFPQPLAGVAPNAVCHLWRTSARAAVTDSEAPRVRAAVVRQPNPSGRPREYLEVVRNCAEQQAVPMPQEHMLIDDGSTESSAAPRLDTDAAAPVLPGQAPTEPMDSADGGRGQRPGADAEAHDLLQECGDGT